MHLLLYIKVRLTQFPTLLDFISYAKNSRAIHKQLVTDLLLSNVFMECCYLSPNQQIHRETYLQEVANVTQNRFFIKDFQDGLTHFFQQKFSFDSMRNIIAISRNLLNRNTY